MKRLLIFIFLCISISTFAQKKFFEKALKNGRSSGSFYRAQIDSDKAVKESDVFKYATEKNYLIRNITYQLVNRFGDKFQGVKSFDFLPKNEIPQIIYESKFKAAYPYKNIITKSKVSVHFWQDKSMFNLFSGFNWSANSSNGFADGEGVGFYYDENKKLAGFFKGIFSNGILQGQGTFATYQYSNFENFDNGSLVSTSIHLRSNYYDDMAVLTVDGKKGFINRDMKEGFYPKYNAIIQEFNNGKAIVLNDKNEEIIINKSGNFIAYSEKQIQIFEQQKRAEEERIRIAEENEKRRIYEEYNVAINSDDEIKLLHFYSKYRYSKYDFAKEYSTTAYNMALILNERNLVPFRNEVDYNQGNTLVKFIFSTIDGSPIALKVDDIYNFLNDSYVRDAYIGNIITNLSKGDIKSGFYSDGEKHFPSIRKPISYMESAVVNAFWYRAGTKSKDTWDKQTGFDTFKDKIRNFASNNGMTVKVSYLGTIDDDIAMEKERIASVQKYREKYCDECYVSSSKDPSPGAFGTRNSGKIIMQNGSSYSWDYKDGGGYESGSDSYPTRDSMVRGLEARCKRTGNCR